MGGVAVSSSQNLGRVLRGVWDPLAVSRVVFGGCDLGGQNEGSNGRGVGVGGPWPVARGLASAWCPRRNFGAKFPPGTWESW